jgi:hypothetical protein
MNIYGEGSLDLTDGTANIVIESAQISNLDPSDNVETDADRVLVSGGGGGGDTPYNTSTGVKEGGIVTATLFTQVFDVSAGTGTINFGGTITDVSWSAIVSEPIITTGTNFIMVDNTGTILKTTTIATLETQRQYISLAAIGVNSTVIIAVVPNQTQLYNQANAIHDLTFSLGIFNESGNVFSANGTNLTVNKSSGEIYDYVGNVWNDINNPSLTSQTALVSPTINVLTQTGAIGQSTTLDTANYDVAGTPTAIPGGSGMWQVFRLYTTSGNIILYEYGQVVYSSQDAAIGAVTTESHISTLGKGVLLRAYVVAKKNTADLSDSENTFITASRFGDNTGGGTGTITSLQSAYDNSVAPQILTDAVSGSVQIQNGQALDTDLNLEVLNIAGTTTFSVDGDGLVVVDSILPTLGIKIGASAGDSLQDATGIAIGASAGEIDQSTNTVAIGNNAGFNTQQANAIAIGNLAGNEEEGTNAVAIGFSAGRLFQGLGCVAIGKLSGDANQQNNSIAIGTNAGLTGQQVNSVAMGINAGVTNQGTLSVAIGSSAGLTDQMGSCVAIGILSGSTDQSVNSVAVGVRAGSTNQGSSCVGLGNQAGEIDQGNNAISIGVVAGEVSQSDSAVAIGSNAGRMSQGVSAIAIGKLAGSVSQASTSIVLNATGIALENTVSDTCVIKPIRSVATTVPAGFEPMYWNPTTGEIIVVT